MDAFMGELVKEVGKVMKTEFEKVNERLDHMIHTTRLREKSKPQEYDPYQYQSAQRCKRSPSSKHKEFKSKTTKFESFEQVYERLVMQANQAKEVQAPTQVVSSPEIDQAIEEKARIPKSDTYQSDLSISIDFIPTVSHGTLKIEEIEVESSEIAIDVTDIVADKSQAVKVEDWDLKIVEHVDFIGVEAFDANPTRELANFFDKLQIIGLSRGILFSKFQVSKKHNKYSKYLFSWRGRFEQFLVRSKFKYSKYLFCWHGRNQASRGNSRTSSFQEEGNDGDKANAWNEDNSGYSSSKAYSSSNRSNYKVAG